MTIIIWLMHGYDNKNLGNADINMNRALELELETLERDDEEIEDATEMRYRN